MYFCTLTGRGCASEKWKLTSEARLCNGPKIAKDRWFLVVDLQRNGVCCGSIRYNELRNFLLLRSLHRKTSSRENLRQIIPECL